MCRISSFLTVVAILTKKGEFSEAEKQNIAETRRGKKFKKKRKKSIHEQIRGKGESGKNFKRKKIPLLKIIEKGEKE